MNRDGGGDAVLRTVLESPGAAGSLLLRKVYSAVASRDWVCGSGIFEGYSVPEG